MKHAAGVILTAPDGSHLLLRRTAKATDHALKWAFPGGHIEDDEAPEAAARRELEEETGYVPTKDVVFVEHARRIKDGVDFTTFHARVPEKFGPKLNHEHDSFRWENQDDAQDLNLHPGAVASLKKFDATETQIAKMMKAGELVSPQTFGNFLLCKMRITGTGGSYRPAVDELVWRDPKLYLNAEFVERCSGLPIIMEHPDGGQPLDSDSFKERMVGTILLAYIEGDEVWGIGKIYDDAAKHILETETVSTSPCVVFRPHDMGSKYRTEDGTPLLVEGKPWLLDHLAICEAGVWDKGGAPDGVANDVKADSISTCEDTTVTEKVVEKPAVKTDAAATVVKADSGIVGEKEGEKLDKILKHLDSMHARHDAFESGHSEMAAKFDALCKRMDAFEAKGKEPSKEAEGQKPAHEEHREEAPTEHEGEETEETANLKAEAEPTPLAADGEEQPGEESEHKALETEREENSLKANDAARADAAKVRDRLEAIEQHVNMPEDKRTQFVSAQLKAERVHQAFGDSAGAPRWMQGETLDQYRRRLIGAFKKYSKGWADVELVPFVGKALDTVEQQVYGDAIAAARHPADLEAGTLRMVINEDETGRRIRRFFGDPEACWGPFKQPTRRVVGFTTKFH